MSDAEAQRLLVQGAIVGMLSLREDVAVTQGVDADGTYLPWFDVALEWGPRARVHVEQLPAAAEGEQDPASPGGLDAPENADVKAVHDAIRAGLRDNGSHHGHPEQAVALGLVLELSADHQAFLTGVLTSRVLHALARRGRTTS